MKKNFLNRTSIYFIVAVGIIVVSTCLYIYYRDSNQSKLNHTNSSNSFVTKKYISLDDDGYKEWLEITQPQGSGGFIDYAVYILHKNGELKQVYSEEGIYQGRVDIIDKTVRITAGYPRDGDANCCPSRDRIRTFGLVDGNFELMSEEIIEKLNQ